MDQNEAVNTLRESVTGDGPGPSTWDSAGSQELREDVRRRKEEGIELARVLLLFYTRRWYSWAEKLI